MFTLQEIDFLMEAFNQKPVNLTLAQIASGVKLADFIIPLGHKLEAIKQDLINEINKNAEVKEINVDKE